jgi:hypothetical protein
MLLLLLLVRVMLPFLMLLQALMNAEGGADIMPAVMNLFGGGGGGTAGMEDGGPVLAAVNLAACVARSIPVVEAFVEWGVRPSALALSRVERTVPLMR